jgi:hypothetical protein
MNRLLFTRVSSNGDKGQQVKKTLLFSLCWQGVILLVHWLQRPMGCRRRISESNSTNRIKSRRIVGKQKITLLLPLLVLLLLFLI